MALEGWGYRKFDEVIEKLGKASLPKEPIPASTIADRCNEGGWTNVFDTLVKHLGLNHNSIELTTSYTMSLPGNCEMHATTHDNSITVYSYKITVNHQFLDNPFSIAAILAHELCHIVYNEKLDQTPKSTGYVQRTEKATLEMERTVDLLVSMFRMSEYQLRVARDTRLILGYFNREVFERIQVIVARKLGSV